MEKGQEWKGITYNPDELEYLRELLIKIKSHFNKPYSEAHFKEVYEYCYHFFRRFPVPIVNVTDKMILRARPNLNGELFTTQEEISYNSKNPHLIKLGRFNLPFEPVYYGCLPTVGQSASFVVTSMLESRKELFDKVNTETQFDFTIGTWEPNPFMAICLCFDNRHLETNQRMKEAVDYHRHYIQERCSATDANFIFETLDYFSNLSSIIVADEGAYMILTAVFTALRMIYKQENTTVNGIVYPSSITESKGLNIALTKAAVDTHLKLTQAVMHRIERRSTDEFQLNIYPITQIEKVIDGKFQFSDIGDKRVEIEENKYI